ncbi:MAG: DUF3343 domain-containing protein [Oscillospiraceae bacterium]
MDRYLATFHTHLAALRSSRTLTALGLSARMMPVPRKVSSSCGTCVAYEAPGPMTEQMDEDAENIYRVEGESYQLVHQFDE